MEERHLKIMFRKARSTGKGNAVGTSMSVPVIWVRALNITHENRDVIATFDGTTITIRKDNSDEEA